MQLVIEREKKSRICNSCHSLKYFCIESILELKGKICSAYDETGANLMDKLGNHIRSIIEYLYLNVTLSNNYAG